MAEYLVLVYEDEAAWAASSREEQDTVVAAHKCFADKIGEMGGAMLGGNALESTATATSVRSDVVTDGPFVETKEALGGYYVIEAADLDHALAIARLCPSAHGGVEVRPIKAI